MDMCPRGQARSKRTGERVDGWKGPEFWLRASQLPCADLNKPLPTSPKYPPPILIAIATIYCGPRSMIGPLVASSHLITQLPDERGVLLYPF